MKTTIEEKHCVTVAKRNGWLVICDSLVPEPPRVLTPIAACEQNMNRCPD